MREEEEEEEEEEQLRRRLSLPPRHSARATSIRYLPGLLLLSSWGLSGRCRGEEAGWAMWCASTYGDVLPRVCCDGGNLRREC